MYTTIFFSNQIQTKCFDDITYRIRPIYFCGLNRIKEQLVIHWDTTLRRLRTQLIQFISNNIKDTPDKEVQIIVQISSKRLQCSCKKIGAFYKFIPLFLAFAYFVWTKGWVDEADEWSGAITTPSIGGRPGF